jgi:hypothetical protein
MIVRIKIQKTMMGWPCGWDGEKEEYVQNFCEQNSWKTKTWKTAKIGR